MLKKDGRLVRPVAVGDVFRRLISKCCVRLFTESASRYLKPLQLGVGVENGAETLILAFNRYIRNPASCTDDSATALIDFVNAFNQVSRERILGEVMSHFPGLFGWVQYSYSTGATLFSGTNIVMATAGVQRGDPLGPLLFALVMQPLLRTLKSVFGLTTGAYLDDLTIAGPQSRVAEAIWWHGSIQ